MKTLGVILFTLAIGVILVGPVIAQTSETAMARPSSPKTPMYNEHTIHCSVSGSGGHALYEGKQSEFIGVHSLELDYVTSGFFSSKRRHWKGVYSWYTLALFQSGVGHVGSRQCG